MVRGGEGEGEGVVDGGDGGCGGGSGGGDSSFFAPHFQLRIIRDIYILQIKKIKKIIC